MTNLIFQNGTVYYCASVDGIEVRLDKKEGEIFTPFLQVIRPTWAPAPGDILCEGQYKNGERFVS